MTQPELTALIQDTRAGNPQAQEKLLLEIENQVYYHCKKIMKNESEAQEAAQDVLVTILTNLDKLQKTAAFSSWVSGVAANHCMQLLIQHGYAWPASEAGEGGTPEEPESLDSRSVPDAVLENIEARQRLLEIMDSLPAEQRMCLLLYYYDGMCIQDVAQAMDTGEDAIKSHLCRACAAIRSGVEEMEQQGANFYGIAPLPLLLFFLQRDALHSTLSTAQSSRLSSAVLASLRITVPKSRTAPGAESGKWVTLVKIGIGLLAVSVAAMVLILRFLWK